MDLTSLDIRGWVEAAQIAIIAMCSIGALIYVWAMVKLFGDRRLLNQALKEGSAGLVITQMEATTAGGQSSVAVKMAIVMRAQLRAPGARASFTELLDSGAQELDTRVLHARRIQRTIVFVALIGTLAGLTSGVSTIANIQLPSNPEAILDPVRQAFQQFAQFGEAFKATLYGVIGTVILAAIDSVYSRSVERYLGQFEQFVAEILQPELLRKYRIVSASSITDRATHILESMSNDMPKAAQEMLYIANQAAALVEQTTKTADAVRESVAGLAQLPGRLDAQLTSIRAVHTALLAAQADSRTANQALTESAARTSATLTNIEAAMRQLHTTTQQLATSTNAIAQALARLQQREAAAAARQPTGPPPDDFQVRGPRVNMRDTQPDSMWDKFLGWFGIRR